MNTLISLSQSIYDMPWLYERLAYAGDGDAILLTQDAVLALHSPIALASFFAKCRAMGVAVYALSEDIEMRNIDNQYTDCGLVDYAGYVTLICDTGKQVAW